MRISDWSSDVCSSDLSCATPVAGDPLFKLRFEVCGALAQTPPAFELAARATDAVAEYRGDLVGPRVDIERAARSAERRVGKEWVCTCTPRGSPNRYKNRTRKNGQRQSIQTRST